MNDLRLALLQCESRPGDVPLNLRRHLAPQPKVPRYPSRTPR